MAATTKTRDVVSELYTSMLDDPELPVPVQWRIYRYAERAGKAPLMAKLAALPALDPELDAQLATRTEGRVLAAWIGRAGRPVDQVLGVLEAARKGPVHPAAAAIRGLPRQAYQKLAEDGRADTAQTLLANPHVPQDVKALAATTLGRTYRRSAWSASRDLEAMFTDQVDLLAALASQTTNPAVLTFVLTRVALTAAQLRDLLERTLLPLMPAETWAQLRWEAARDTCEAVAALFAQPALPAEDHRRAHAAWQAWAGCNPTLVQGYMAEAVNRAYKTRPNTGLAKAAHPQVELVRSAVSPQEVAAALQLVLGSGNPEMAVALAANPAADADTVTAVLRLIPREVIRRVAHTRARDLPVLAALVARYEDLDILADDLLAASGRPAEALVAIAREYRLSGRKVSTRLGKSEYLTPSVMGALPLSFTATNGTMLARRAVGDLLAQALAGDADWQLFETLGNSFDGPLENLLLACGYIADTGAPAVEPEPAAEPAPPPRRPHPAPVPTHPVPAGMVSDTLF